MLSKALIFSVSMLLSVAAKADDPAEYTIIGVEPGNGNVLRIRSGPGVKSPVKGLRLKGATGIKIIGEGVLVGTEEWVPIIYSDGGNLKGWTLRKYLQAATPATAKAVPPARKPVAAPAQRPESNDGKMEAGKDYVVTGVEAGDTLNIRAGAGTNFPVAAKLSNGTGIKANGIVVMNGNDEWISISFEGGKGWTRPKYLLPAKAVSAKSADPVSAKRADAVSAKSGATVGVRLGDTIEKCDARYGKPTAIGKAFRHYQNGEYRVEIKFGSGKIWNIAIIKNKGSFILTKEEIEKHLTEHLGPWKKSRVRDTYSPSDFTDTVAWMSNIGRLEFMHEDRYRIEMMFIEDELWDPDE